MNLDDRIARDAEQWRKDDHAPPFEPGLERATAAPGRRRETWLAVACVIALVCGIVAVFALRDRANDDTPAATVPSPAISVSLPAPHTVTRDGRTYYAQVVATRGVVIDPGDSSHLFAYHFDMYNKDAKPGCNNFDSSARVVAQDERTITVATFAYGVRTRPDVTCGFTEFAHDPRPLVLALGRGRDGRRVIDAYTGAPIPVFTKGTTPPKPTYVPAGLRQTDVEGSGMSFVYGAGSVRTFTDGQGESVDIRLGSAAPENATHIIGSSEVHGRNAMVTRDAYEQCVSWTVSGYRRLEVCSPASGSNVRPVAELLKIARSLS